MKFCLFVVFTCIVYSSVKAAQKMPPKVQVYAHYPWKDGQQNTLICYVSEFYPPDITIDLLEGGLVLPGAHQTDLAFENGWQFYITKSVPFTPEAGKAYGCRVKHVDKTVDYHWDPDM